MTNSELDIPPDLRPFCLCSVCDAPLSGEELGDIGLRSPDSGETLEEYCDAELVDPGELRHLRCIRDMAG